MKKYIKNILAAAEAIERLLHPQAEIVVHDIKLDEIVAIYHPLSKRKVGDPSLFTKEEKEMANLADCIGPYEKINWDGRKFKSVSSVIRDENNKAIGMLCINFDISAFENFNQFLSNFINYKNFEQKPEPLFKDDWQEKIHIYIHNYLQENHLSLAILNRQEKKHLIEHLHEVGAFTGKNSAKYIAEILEVSRATVYNYLSRNNY